MRTLDYKAIKAGIRRAGPVPTLGCEDVLVVAWLSAAGYGIACKPALLLYQKYRAALNGTYEFSRPRRRRRIGVTESTIKSLSGIAAKLRIPYGGEVQDKIQLERRMAVRSKLGFRWKSIVEQVKPLDNEVRELQRAERKEEFILRSGFFVAAAIKAHNGQPSKSYIIDTWTSESFAIGPTAIGKLGTVYPSPVGKSKRDITLIKLAISTPTGLVVEIIPTSDELGYGAKNPEALNKFFHLGAALIRRGRTECTTI